MEKRRIWDKHPGSATLETSNKNKKQIEKQSVPKKLFKYLTHFSNTKISWAPPSLEVVGGIGEEATIVSQIV
jgi:hypothetical protein